MKKRTILFSGAAVAAVLSLTASLGAVAAPGAAPAAAGTGTYTCTLNTKDGVPPCTLHAAPAAAPAPAEAVAAAPVVEPVPAAAAPAPAAAPITVLPASTGSGLAPLGVPGAWSQTFSDDFNGTALDTSKWSSSWFGGGTMNKVKTSPANVSVGGGNLSLKLSDAGTGALVSSNPNDAATTGYAFRTGYTEARISFPGNGTVLHNWPAWWTTGQSWPATGENDIAEVLKGQMTSNYHSGSGSHNQGTIAGSWGNEYHTYGLWRKANVSEVYVDGVKVKSFPTDDGNAAQYLVLNVGKAGTSTTYGPASEMKVDYVRAWQ
ncbi:glycoside hydrolase family 16 protein [Arthrobacter sp. PsM3]|uniref:glycoside hydrolase family 16 protein n=1 Tax=Arthrobacter sp. PsM3 TaxID=3030531 RepID=UPI00263BC183|nr:glycoside hydrolase family 16 protein [Arthrobacter sp. PsM3]MDN4642901.1 glycoside hydrolase family 16 protein [Arthrobacter sp. PsM3]